MKPNVFVGENFNRNLKQMCKLLGDDQVFIIGVHGMAGVGKTVLVTYIENDINLNRKDSFKHVFFVTVSRDFSIFKLQNEVAKRIGVTLDGDDERIRAKKLSLALEGKEKSVLILDDVWKNIDLEKVGIPLGVNGIKLILTSRLEHVCYQMDCLPNSIIRMEPLSDEEAWELFLLILGNHATPAKLPHEVEKIARSIAKECYGLPLGISVMARTMKGVTDDIRWWKHSLNKFQNFAMEEKIFDVLKLSYDNLTDKNMQNCFLSCALYHGIGRKELVFKLFDEGLLNDTRLERISDGGLTIVDKLKGHSLLLENDYLHMHGLVRNMVCQILKLSHRYMVKCNEGLTKVPAMLDWTTDLEKVSLMNNNIKEIPKGTSPNCPNLSTLIFSGNPLHRIPDCFFSNMNALAVLDLSCNPFLTLLPKTVSNLRSLVSLLLGGCKSLEYVPPLEQLQALSRLDISGTSIEEVPQGLEMLTNLKWLDLSENYNLTLLPGSVLPGLTNMQYLDIRYNYGSAKVNAKDVLGMTMLEHFAGSFHDCDNFNCYVQATLDRDCGPKTYNLHLGIGPGYFSDYSCDYNFPANNDCRIVSFGDCTKLDHVLPTDIARLCIAENKQWICLCDVLSFRSHSSLMYINIQACPKLESLFCLTSPCSLCSNLQNLESLNLKNLEGLAFMWKDFPPGGMFSHIKHLVVSKCHKIEKLLAIGSMLLLKHLVTLDVKCCYLLKEIFTEDVGRVKELTLPKLTRLEFRDLPQLETVWRGTIVGGLSPKLNIIDCPKLTRPILQSHS
uniref:Disease resistance protein At4g27220 family n=2 Tax=Cajanus cajan TaxID=3821 RepID=A0A151U841_CAJCA|nr:putative disease resistance protein At4g27220 family [Cajanus cajan]